MDAGWFRDRIAVASNEEREKILACLQTEQARRDQERAEREKRQAKWQILQVWASGATVVALLLTAVSVFVSIGTLSQGSENLRLQREAQTSQQDAATRQDQESRYSSLYGLYQDMEKTIATYPPLIPCFYTFRSIEGDTDIPGHCHARNDFTARLLAAYVADFYAYLYTELQTLNSVQKLSVPSDGEFVLRTDPEAKTTDEGWISWSETIVYAFNDGIMLCDQLENAADAYTTDFRHALAKALTGIEIKNRHCTGIQDPGT
jgi:hypothetical protein